MLGDNKSKLSKAYSIVYSIPEDTFREVALPMPIGMRLSNFINIQLISYDYSKILIQDAVRYRVLIYDLDGELRDSIIRDTSTFLVKTSYPNSPEKSDLMTMYKNRFTLEFARMTDSNSLLTCWAVPSGDGITKNYYYDIWNYKCDSGWTLTKSDIQISKPDSNEKFSPDLFRIPGLFYFDIYDNRIYTIEHFPFEIDNNILGLSNKELEVKMNNFLETNEPIYKLIVRKIH